MKKLYALLFACFCFALNSQAQLPSYIPAKGLVGWWPFTGNAIDSSTYDNDGTVYGAILTKDRFGNTNSAYDFDGLDDYIDLDTAGLSASPDTFSIAAWFKLRGKHPDGSSGWYNSVILSKRQLVEHSFVSLVVDNDSFPTFQITMTDYTSHAKPKINVIDGKWHHMVGVKMRSNYKLYLDGSLDATNTDPIVISSPDHMNVGHDGAWLSFFDGQIDDVGTWSRALTDDEVKKLFESKPDPVTSVQEVAASSPFIISPNPAHDIIHVSMDASILPLDYTISDVSGKTIISGRFISANETVNTTAFPTGTYIIRAANQMQSIKFTKQ